MYNDMGMTGITYLCRRRQFATHIVMILHILHIKHNDGDTQNHIIKGRSTLYVTTKTQLKYNNKQWNSSANNSENSKNRQK